MSDPTPADVLREAANVVRREGWCRGAFSDEDGRVCALGALREVGYQAGLGLGTRWAVMSALLDVVRGGDIATWNDEEAIDGEDVAVHMEKAAIRWEEIAGLEVSSGAGS